MTRLTPKPYWLIVIVLTWFPVLVSAQLQVNTVSSTPSTCANNGTITVDAVTISPPLLYSITAGPVTAATQTSAVFNALPAGTYTVRVTDGALRSASREVVIDGNYLPPDMSPIAVSPYCSGGSDGRITGNRVWGTGNGPFTWELIAPSPVTAPPQYDDVFTGLPAGDYTLKLTDGCGGFITRLVTVSNPPPANIILPVPPRITMRGCDSGLITMDLHADIFRFPLTCTFTTGSGSFTTTTPTVLDTLSFCCGGFRLEQLLPGFTYGDHVQVAITDSCGATLNTPVYYARSFNFCTLTTHYFEDCGYKTAIVFDLNNGACETPGSISTAVKAPLTYVVTDPVTNEVLDADTVKGYRNNDGYSIVSGATVMGLPANKTYHIVFKDSCGRTTFNDFYVAGVVAPAASISSVNVYPSGCVDSAAFAFVFADHFKQQPKLVLLSGPARMGSAKAGYAYESNYTYPDTMEVMGFGSTSARFDIGNLSAGTYQFKVVDSCGSEVFDKITISPAEVTSFSHEFTYRKGCPGNNKLFYRVATANGTMYIRNLTTGQEVVRYYQSQDFTAFVHDSLTNLSSGAYELVFTYYAAFGSSTPANSTPVVCQQIKDTLVIDGYRPPAITINNYLQCKANTYLELVADSSRGVAPFAYEIISGPQLFPRQDGNVFNAAAAGTYTARIYDACGNAAATQVSVSAITFPPAAVLPFSCNSTRLTYGTSAYYTYRWKAPGGTVYTTDTLTINPITAADTGLYTIERAVDINGCSDTSITTYRLQMANVYAQKINICPGHSVTIGTHTYSVAGIFTDTLKNVHQCDSIVVSHITVLPFKRDSVYHTLCPGQQLLFNGQLYNAAGIYHDTLATAGCDSIVTLLLSINLKRDSVVQTICASTAYNFNGRLLTLPGIYRDTLPTATCDSIVVLNLLVLPLKRDTIAETICAGEIRLFNGRALTESGVYRDTLPTATCDSIIVLNLAVTAPAVEVAADPLTIVTGASVQLQATEAATYTWTGTGVVFDNARVQNPVATPARSGWIYLHATSDPEGCAISDSVFITVLDKSTYCADAYIYLPTAFTPNGDGHNDVFRIVSQKITLKSFRIFNRWGEQVFVTSDIAVGWNGRYKGGMLPGSYVYMITYTDCMGRVKLTKGNIVLLL